MPSTESSTESSTDHLTPEQAVQEQLERKANVLNLLRMSAVKQIKKSLAWEQALAEKHSDADYEVMYSSAPTDGDADSEADSEVATKSKPDVLDDDMENMVGGNQTVHHNYPPPAAAAAPPPPPVKNGIGTLGSILLGAGLVAGSAGAGVAISELMDDDPVVSVDAVDTDTDTITTLDFID